MTGRKRGVPRAAAFAVLGGSVLGVAATGSTATADMIDGGTPGVLTIEAMPGTIELILDPGEHGSWLLTPRLDSGGGRDEIGRASGRESEQRAVRGRRSRAGGHGNLASGS